MAGARTGTFIGPPGYYQNDLATVQPQDNVFAPGAAPLTPSQSPSSTTTPSTPAPVPAPTPAAPTPTPAPKATNPSVPGIIGSVQQTIQSVENAYWDSWKTTTSTVLPNINR